MLKGFPICYIKAELLLGTILPPVPNFLFSPARCTASSTVFHVVPPTPLLAKPTSIPML